MVDIAEFDRETAKQLQSRAKDVFTLSGVVWRSAKIG